MSESPRRSGSSPAGSNQSTGGEEQSSRALTLALSTLASLVFFLLRLETTDWSWVASLQSGVSVVGAWIALLSWQQIERRAKNVPVWANLTIAAWALQPAICESGWRWLGYGEAFEIVLLACFQNAALMMAAVSEKNHRLSCLMSAFLVLYSVSLSQRDWVPFASNIYWCALFGWLMENYWRSVKRDAKVERLRVARLARVSGLTIALVVIVCMQLFSSASGTRKVLAGFSPFSGGEEYADSYAREGVGDGDMLVAAEKEAMSFGPVDSDVFADSKKPSMYDLFNDMYGDPPRPLNQRNRAIAISAEQQNEEHLHLEKSQQTSNSFSTVRERRKTTQADDDEVRTAAMLYLVGRVPQHLALERFQIFDGAEWRGSEQPEKHPEPRLVQKTLTPWIRLRSEQNEELFHDFEHHAVKIINLETMRVPAPDQITAVHIDRLEEPSFFGWTNDSSLYMPGRDMIPELTVIHTRSAMLDLQKLRVPEPVTSLQVNPGADGDEVATSALEPEHIHPIWTTQEKWEETLAVPPSLQRYAQFSRRWCDDVPRGWDQVQVIVGKVRNSFVHDPQASPPIDCTDIIGYFFRNQRGTDFLFATTAAILLREQGYPTRLVSGFYARPERFERLSGQTKVIGEDVHVWLEVCVDGRNWIAVEPTPGFEPPREHLSLMRRIQLLGKSVGQGLLLHWIGLAYGLVVALCLWASRVTWLDFLLTGIVHSASLLHPHRQVAWTLRLMDWRLWMLGKPRPKYLTMRRWLLEVQTRFLSNQIESADEFLTVVESQLYGAVPGNPNSNLDSVRRTCSLFLRHARLSSLRNRLIKPGKPA